MAAAAAGTTHDGNLTILMYPWFAMGHITPYLATANKLADRGHAVTLIIPANTLSHLQPRNLHPTLIQFFPISLPFVHGLPSHVNTTADISDLHQLLLLQQAMDLTQPTLDSLLSDLNPDIVFYDLAGWLPALARPRGIKSVYYSAGCPALVCFFFVDEAASFEDILYGPPGFPSSIKLSRHAARELKSFLNLKYPNSNVRVVQRWVTGMRDGDAIGFRTCEQTEGIYCRFLENKLNKNILLTGPIVPKAQSSASLEEKWGAWLAQFKPKSVIFCALGSEAVLQKDQFQQLLLGLEQSGYPFVISLKPPVGANTVEEALPDGFKERTGERGIVHGGWAPQHLIMEHPSVGCFVTHCGYGSMWEGVMSECQLVALPLRQDQIIHSRLLSRELKIAVEVEEGEEDGMFTKEAVCGAITAAMEDETEGGIGKEVRDNHAKWRGLLLKEGFLDSCFDAFVGKLRTL